MSQNILEKFGKLFLPAGATPVGFALFYPPATGERGFQEQEASRLLIDGIGALLVEPPHASARDRLSDPKIWMDARADFAEILSALRAQFGLVSQKVAVIGKNLGGTIAAHVAAGEDIACLIVTGSIPRLSEFWSRSSHPVATRWREGLDPASIEAFVTAMRPFDLVENFGNSRARKLAQFGYKDDWVDAAEARLIRASEWTADDHEMHGPASVERRLHFVRDAILGSKKFKGWTVPGHRPSSAVEPATGESLDAISGHFKLFQLKDGHRFSTDDVVLAWFALTQAPQPARILDLGTGIGTVGMIMAHKAVGAQFVTIEAQSVSYALSQKSARFNDLTARFDQRFGDFRDPSVLDPGETFDLITGSPPYFPETGGVLPTHEQKKACRFELRGTVADYAEVAARHLAPGGVFACVFPVDPPMQLERAHAALRDAGLKLIRQRMVSFKEGETPLIGLFAGMRTEDLPDGVETWTDPPLVIRNRAGAVHPEYQAIKLSIGFPP